MRTFIAIELAQPLRHQLDRFMETLRKTRASVKWVEQENLHLTLQFLGEIPSDSLGMLQKALSEAAQKVFCFSVELAGTGVFPSPSRPKVVWVGIRNDVPALTRLHQFLRENLEARGFLIGTRPFSPHITLGRFRADDQDSRLKEVLKANVNIRIGVQPVRQITVFESRLERTGPQYLPLARIPLLNSLTD